MKLLIVLSCLSLAGLVIGAPATNTDNDKVVVTKEFYPLSFVKYKSQHDIVSILLPLNSLNFDENDSKSSEEVDPKLTIFFVEADVDDNGKRTYQGLYAFKDNKATKLLENGRDAAASSDDSTKVFLAAQDGLYVYKAETNEAVKYGTVTDSIIGIAKTDTGDLIYILTEDHEVYKVTNDGTVKTKVDEVVNAQEIVLDMQNNLYFYDQDLQPYVVAAGGVKKIEGLPANPKTVKLIRPPFILEDSVPFLVDNTVYIIYANGTSETSDFEFEPKAKPTAYGMEATLIMYYGYDKKIYEYNLVAMIAGDIIKELEDVLEDKNSTIQSLSSQKKFSKRL